MGGTAIRATAGAIMRMPANLPHAVDAVGASLLLLDMLRERPVD